MKIIALTKQSLKSIWSNKIRSSLTILGIVIGIAAVISLVGLGKGLQSNVTNRISNLGITDISIRSQDPERQTTQRQGGAPEGGPDGGGGPGGFSFGSNDSASITTDEYQYIKNLEDITAASPSESTQVAVTKSSTSDTASQYQLYGVDTDYLSLEDLEVTAGANLTEEQVTNSDKVVLIGDKAAEELFETTSPVGQTIYLEDTAYTIVGTFQQKETEDSQSAQDQAGPGGGGMPGGVNRVTSSFITGYKTWLTQAGKEKLSSVSATASSENVVESVASQIETKLYADHSVTEDNADVSITTSEDLLETASSVASSFTTTLTGIATISLVVGGIGIMNIMLVTVTERTREIGLRRALGAKSKHIVYQFLIESVLLTLIGGLLGVAIGILFGSNVTNLIGNFGGPGRGGNSTDTKVVIDLTTVFLAVGISSLIGIIFGLFPAIKASKLDPVEALRYE